MKSFCTDSSDDFYFKQSHDSSKAKKYVSRDLKKISFYDLQEGVKIVDSGHWHATDVLFCV